MSSSPARGLIPATEIKSAQRLGLSVLLLLLLAGVLVLPIWLVKYPPLVDYPNHLARTYILAHMGEKGFWLRQFYGVQWGLYPYLVMDLVLLALQTVFAVEIAGKILLSLCVLAIPASVWMFLRRVNPSQPALALCALPFTYNIFFLSGFLAYQLSIAVCFLLLAVCLDYIKKQSLARFCLCLLLATLLYFTHLVGFALAGLVLGLYGLATRQRVKFFGFLFLIFLPGTAFWAINKATVGISSLLIMGNPKEKLIGLSEVMRGYSTRLDLVCLLALLGTVLAMWVRNREVRWNRAWLWPSAAVFGLYWVFPMVYGTGWDADTRILLFTALLAWATVDFGRRTKWLVPVVLVLTMLRVTNVAYHFVQEQPRLASMAQSFSTPPPNSRVLPVVSSWGERQIQQPYRHFWAYGVIEHHWFAPYLFTDQGVQPLTKVYPAYDPPGFWSFRYTSPLSLPRIQQDYDYVWAYNVEAMAHDFATIGDVAFRQGDLTVYKIRPRANPATPLNAGAGNVGKRESRGLRGGS